MIIKGLGRCIVVLLNVVFIIFSFILLLLGVFAYLFSSIPMFASIEEGIKDSLTTMSSSVGVSSDGIDDFSISTFLDGIGMALIISGCVLLALSFFGCCGACYKFKTLIFIYGMIVSVLLIAEILVVILMYAAPDTIQGHIKDGLKESLKDYKGIGKSDVTTLSWMFVMKEMDCCGVDGYNDFQSTTTDDWKRPGSVSPDVDAPLVCCKVQPTGNSAAATNCARTATLAINEEGCFDVVWGKVLGNPLMAGLVLTVAFVFQLLLVVFSILMFRDGKDNKIQPQA